MHFKYIFVLNSHLTIYNMFKNTNIKKKFKARAQFMFSSSKVMIIGKFTIISIIIRIKYGKNVYMVPIKYMNNVL